LSDTVVVVVQPGSGDTLQFLKAGIMEVPDVLVVTKADMGDTAMRARRDLAAALRTIGARETPVVAVSSLPPAKGVEELVAALDQHRAGLDMDAVRARMRGLAALAAFGAERGESGMRALGGRREAEKLLASFGGDLTVPEMVASLERTAAV
jgi:LAO/AO transport system kinase